MKFFRYISAIALLFLFYSCAPKEVAVEVQKPEIKSLEIIKSGDSAYKALLKGDEKISYSVFYSKESSKISILSDGAVFGDGVPGYKFNDENVEKVVSLMKGSSAIVEIFLKKDADYTYSESEGALSVNINFYKAAISDIGKSGLEAKEADYDEFNVAKHILAFENFSDDAKFLLKFKIDGVARYDYGYVNDKTVYVDIFDVKSDLKAEKFTGKGAVNGIKVGSYYPPQKVRFLAEVKKSMPIFGAQDGEYLTVSSEVGDIPQEMKYITSLESVSVKKYQSVIVKFTGRPTFSKKIVDGNLVVQFSKDVKALKSVVNQNTFDGLPFKKVSVMSIDGSLSIVVIPNGEIFARVENTPEGLLISGSFEEFAKAQEKIAGVTSSAEKDNLKGSVSKKDLVTLNIKDMDTREAIRLVYFGRNKNIVFGKEVAGKVSLFVKDVSYRKALELIYRESNLEEVEDGNIVWVISKQRKDEIEASRIKAAKQLEQKKELDPLFTEIVPVNFSTATDFQGILKALLSDRGIIQIEKRTNSFVITDRRENLEQAKQLLVELDKPTPQVTIEARIVEVFNSNNTNLGIQWGAKYANSTTAYDFPGSYSVTGNTGASAPGSGNGYIVNMPVASPTGALAITLGSLTGNYGLDIALSALESQNKAKTISSPRITTLDNQEAEIKSGGTAIIVPVGDNTEAKEIDVGIKLKVKPHITANNMVYMEIEVEKSTLGQVTANTATTEEKKAKTQVLLASGETTVIGGIYEDEKTEITQGIPGLSKIPVLGWLFKTKNTIVSKKELLVFLTPKVK